MKNKAEREKFLKKYKKWAMGGNYAEVNRRDWKTFLRMYCHHFKNGAIVIATECDQKNRANGVNVRYNLIIPDGDDYNPFDLHSGRMSSEFQSYTLEGVSIGTIVDYMTKRRDVI
ncbi:MAG: hypothetical protein FWE05_11905 [Defluviitaleaceae bacterium]|nr:hypothetical protein [Defluviitaleaceae bacterium]